MESIEDLHTIRQLGLAAILSVLFLGGIIVSTKIGGGSNLHNLDAYLVVLWVIGGYVFSGKYNDLTLPWTDQFAQPGSDRTERFLFQYYL
jgi:hypothetical protein